VSSEQWLRIIYIKYLKFCDYFLTKKLNVHINYHNFVVQLISKISFPIEKIVIHRIDNSFLSGELIVLKRCCKILRKDSQCLFISETSPMK
jgi:hypothetical protein